MHSGHAFPFGSERHFGDPGPVFIQHIFIVAQLVGGQEKGAFGRIANGPLHA
jgi:hypothetical protein